MSELTELQKKMVAEEMEKVTDEKLNAMSTTDKLLLFIMLDVMMFNLGNAPFRIIKPIVEILAHYVAIVDGLMKDNK